MCLVLKIREEEEVDSYLPVLLLVGPPYEDWVLLQTSNYYLSKSPDQMRFFFVLTFYVFHG